MTTTVTRVLPGVPAGGQFASTAHTEPSLALAPAPDFDYAFESGRGAELAKALKAMPSVPIRETIAAGTTADILRSSYPDYAADGTATLTRDDAVQTLNEAFRFLPAEQREHHVELIRFAVHVQMKHYADEEYVAQADHGYELLEDPANYAADEWVEQGQAENRDRWGLLADTAAYWAIRADNAASAKEVVRV